MIRELNVTKLSLSKDFTKLKLNILQSKIQNNYLTHKQIHFLSGNVSISESKWLLREWLYYDKYYVHDILKGTLCHLCINFPSTCATF